MREWIVTAEGDQGSTYVYRIQGPETSAMAAQVAYGHHKNLLKSGNVSERLTPGHTVVPAKGTPYQSIRISF